MTHLHDYTGSAKPYTTSIWYEWDPKYLYVAFQVQGRPLFLDPSNPWTSDTLQVFLDFYNTKKGIRDVHTMQTWINLNDMSWGNVEVEPSGAIIKTTKPATYRMVMKKTADGYIAEAAFDWKSLSVNGFVPEDQAFVPQPGALIGLETSIGPESVVGTNAGNNFNFPAGWGDLRLLPEGATPETFTPASETKTK